MESVIPLRLESDRFAVEEISLWKEQSPLGMRRA